VHTRARARPRFLVSCATAVSLVVPCVVATAYFLEAVRAGRRPAGGRAARTPHPSIGPVRAEAGTQNEHQTVYQLIAANFLSTGTDANTNYWVYLIYLFLAANWDAILLFFAMWFVRWEQLVRRAGPAASAHARRG